MKFEFNIYGHGGHLGHVTKYLHKSWLADHMESSHEI